MFSDEGGGDVNASAKVSTQVSLNIADLQLPDDVQGQTNNGVAFNGPLSESDPLILLIKTDSGKTLRLSTEFCNKFVSPH